MELREVFNLEVEGISKTIREYAVENFIVSYTTQLQNCQIPEDNEKVKVIIKRLVEWYEDKMEDIVHSRFVHNKEEHLKSFRLLIEFQKKLN